MAKINGTTVAVIAGTAAVLLLAGTARAAATAAGNSIADQGRGALNPAHPNNIVSRFGEWMYGGGYDNKGTIGSDLWTLLNGREGVRP